ncbi:MAG: hypothetical protein NTW16_06815 [Bacteroidetes bacterium]|nr:hypothetical protein [Bacteroidota bacterium]
MKNSAVLLLTISMVLGCTFTYSQGFNPPSEGKVVVYFARPGSYAKKFEFKIFKDDKFLCELRGENYLRYECEPGNHLFWSVSENHEYMEAALESGKTYIVRAMVTIGAFSGRVFFTPVLYTDKEKFDPAYTLIMQTAPFVPEAVEVEKMNKKQSKMIQENLKRYTSQKAEGKLKISILSSDMAIPAEALK